MLFDGVRDGLAQGTFRHLAAFGQLSAPAQKFGDVSFVDRINRINRMNE
jgi:hypothetical protein